MDDFNSVRRVIFGMVSAKVSFHKQETAQAILDRDLP
jgi:hypothetical protein